MKTTLTFDKFGRLGIPAVLRYKLGSKTVAPVMTERGLLLEPVKLRPRKLVRVKGKLHLKEDPTGPV